MCDSRMSTNIQENGLRAPCVRDSEERLDLSGILLQPHPVTASVTRRCPTSLTPHSPTVTRCQYQQGQSIRTSKLISVSNSVNKGNASPEIQPKIEEKGSRHRAKSRCVSMNTSKLLRGTHMEYSTMSASHRRHTSITETYTSA